MICSTHYFTHFGLKHFIDIQVPYNKKNHLLMFDVYKELNNPRCSSKKIENQILTFLIL